MGETQDFAVASVSVAGQKQVPVSISYDEDTNLIGMDVLKYFDLFVSHRTPLVSLCRDPLCVVPTRRVTLRITKFHPIDRMVAMFDDGVRLQMHKSRARKKACFEVTRHIPQYLTDINWQLLFKEGLDERAVSITTILHEREEVYSREFPRAHAPNGAAL